MINAIDLVAEADCLVTEMASGSPAEIVDLARCLSDLARRSNLSEVAEAADAVGRAAAEAGPKRLVTPMQRLSNAVASVGATLQAA